MNNKEYTYESNIFKTNNKNEQTKYISLCDDNGRKSNDILYTNKTYTEINNDYHPRVHDTFLIKENIYKIVNKYKKLRKNRLLCNNQHVVNGNKKCLKDISSSSSYESGTNTSLSNINCVTCEHHLNEEQNSENEKSTKRALSIVNVETSDQSKRIMKKRYSDKTTYCRPVINYNQEFIYKIMEKNNKIKSMVQKLALARQQEKDNVLWNNYINALKNKHDYKRHPILIQDQEQITSDATENYYNPVLWDHSMPCKDLLDDLYRGYNSPTKFIYPKSRATTDFNSIDNKCTIFQNDSYCSPSSSQGRIYVLQNEKIGKKSKNCLSEANYKNPILLKHKHATLNNRRFKSTMTQSNIQSDNSNTFKPLKHFQNDKAIMVDRDRNSENLLIHRHQKHKGSLKCKSVISIDTKLDTLIESINIFINEMKSYRANNLEQNNITTARIDAIQYHKDKIITKDESVAVDFERFRNIFDYNKEELKFHETLSCVQNMDDIWGLNKNIFKNSYTTYNRNNQESSVQITPEVPTRDCCTEVTKSLSQQIYYFNDVNNFPGEIRKNNTTTIAINTDPLSLVALLKISSDTLKGFLSYIPNINYHSYLPYLQLPKLQWGVTEMVNLNNQQSKDINNRCCIYPKLFEKITGPFKCKFCGKTFTRAYCWELHHFSCARSLGRRHDDSKLTLLS